MLIEKYVTKEGPNMGLDLFFFFGIIWGYGMAFNAVITGVDPQSRPFIRARLLD